MEKSLVSVDEEAVPLDRDHRGVLGDLEGDEGQEHGGGGQDKGAEHCEAHRLQGTPQETEGGWESGGGGRKRRGAKSKK